MTVIAVASAKFSPGVTTTAELLVALRPPGRRCVLVDCDPAGGEWLLRPGVAAEPGLVTLAMAGRRDLEPGALWEHVQVVGDGLEVVMAPAASRQAASALEIVAERLGAQLRSLGDSEAVLDCGRLSPTSPAMPLLRAADQVLVVSRSNVAEIVHLAPCIEQLEADGYPVGVVLVDARRGCPDASYRSAEVAEALGVDVVGVLPDDAGTAGRLFAQPGSTAGLVRSRLVRAAAALAARVLPPRWTPTDSVSAIEVVSDRQAVSR